VDIQNRWSVHKGRLIRNKHHSSYLQRAWNKYGEDAFEFSIIELCFPLVLIFREQYFINTLKPEYNGNPIAGSSFGRKFTPESRAKMSLAAKASMTPERLAKMTERARKQKHTSGWKHTDEAKTKMSEIGKLIHTPEHMAKMTAAAKSPEARAKMSVANKGNKRALGHKHTDETLAKLSKANKGKKASAETCAKMSASHILRRQKKKDE
jgi:group I intron endonuclease